MIAGLRAWHDRRILARRPLADADWRNALDACAPAQRLSAAERLRLRELATLFLARKSLEPVPGFELDSRDRALLSAHACLPILERGLDWYEGWHSVVIYPRAFVAPREEMDEAGVVHHVRDSLAGEAWLQGPVILAWADVLSAGNPPGYNVVVHEMAHKLDLLNGDANGYPPLPRGMRPEEWARVFTEAWDRLETAFDAGEALPLDEYALDSPGEFFAVASEAFFEQPEVLRAELPDLYAQLHRFYKGRIPPPGRKAVRG